jgi:hypothetical protein
MCSPAVCGGIRVAHRISYMCSPAVCGGIRVAHRISHKQKTNKQAQTKRNKTCKATEPFTIYWYEMMALYFCMCSPAVCGGIRVAHRISYMCSPAVCGGIRVAHRISHMCSPAVCGGIRLAHRISHMCSPAVCGGIRVAHRISHLCCVLVFCFPSHHKPLVNTCAREG